MSIAAEAIFNAITEALNGTLTSTRGVDKNAMGSGVFDGQPVQAQQARARNTGKAHWFDVRMLGQLRHGSTPASINGSYRNVLVPVEVTITTTLKTTAQDSDRMAQRAAAASVADDAVQALTYPGNLTTDAAGTATGIVSGMLFGPDGTGLPQWSVTAEDWDLQLHRSVIRGGAVVVVTQATS
jgi:hypothetical protein